MKTFLIYFMIYSGSALMAYNIYRYVRFSGRVRARGNWDREYRLLNLPIALLVLFLLGYLLVGIFGDPDMVVAGILFGGSIFVFVMLLLIQRIFDRIRENERLEAKLSAAESANMAKTFFLSNMSHDIRTPLNAIIGYTGLAKQDSVSPQEQRNYLIKIEKAGRQLLDIVNNVLEMSRIESGKLDYHPARMDLNACLQDTADLVRTQMEEKQIDFSVSPDARHNWVVCDRHLLSRALMNLLSNAVKFTGENGKVSLRLIELPGTEETGSYEIHVEDSGTGISPDFVEHLFTPFEREQTSTISKTQGTGLGMAITKSIVDLMGGAIEVHSEPGKGSEFIISVSLPLAGPEESRDAEESEPAGFDGLRALLTEDNPVNMEIAVMLLTQAGFSVETAENGEIAVDMVSAAEPGYYDVILMDIQMPVMDGYAAARAIRSLPDRELAGIPIIAMTANAFQNDIREAEAAGMNGHIAKPLDVPVMLKTLREVLYSGESKTGGSTLCRNIFPN